MNNDNTKVCTKCNVEKPFSEFYRRQSSKDGHRTECKLCENTRSKIAYNSNPDYHRGRSRQWRIKNPEKHASAKRSWKEANPEKVKVYEKTYYQKNSEKVRNRVKKYSIENSEKIKISNSRYQLIHADEIRTYKKQWAKNNPEKISNSRNRRRTRIKNNKVFFIRDSFMKKLYGSGCVYCGTKENITADHIIPISRGGSHSEGNLQPLCAKCNSSKCDKFMYEWKLLKTKINIHSV